MTRLPSRVALPEEKRETMVKHLNTALAMSIDLSLQVKQAHWNIKGPQFFARHPGWLRRGHGEAVRRA